MDTGHFASLAFAPDVANAVVAALAAADPPPVLHVACREAVSVGALVGLVAAARGLPQPRLDATRRAPLLSVDVGPIAVDAALAALDWAPTPLADAVRATVAWYDDAAHVRYTRRLADGDESDDADASASDDADAPRPKNPPAA